MPDRVARKRLKKKMLDRWENEGGRIAADSTIAPDGNRASNRQREGNPRSVSRDSSTVGAPATPTKKRKLRQK